MRRILLTMAFATLPGWAAAQAIPSHPDELEFEPISFTPPKAADHRVVLENGMVVYIAQDPTLPLVNISMTMRVGSYLEPAGKEGLAALTGDLMRRGGTSSLTAEDLDERADFLAANISVGIGSTSGRASLNCLSDNLDESLALFVEILREPRFQADRLSLAKEQAIQEMKKRNDDSADIEAREWRSLIYGDEHFTNRLSTKASIESITHEDLAGFHRSWLHPAGAIAAVSGSFDREMMLDELQSAFADWPTAAPDVPDVPGAIIPASPGLYRIQKDVNQGRVSVGMPSIKLNDPDYHALMVMNDILGGSGFTSRIVRRVRSDEGLAYSAGSRMQPGVHYAGRFRAGFQSKSRSVAYATSLVLGEMKRIREEPVSDEDLDTIKNSLIESFPSNFSSKAQAVGTFARDEFTGRDASFWETYREKVGAVTKADVQRVAQKHLQADQVRILVVGNQSEIDAGDGEHDVSLGELSVGKDTTIPLPDPLTLERPSS